MNWKRFPMLFELGTSLVCEGLLKSLTTYLRWQTHWYVHQTIRNIRHIHGLDWDFPINGWRLWLRSPVLIQVKPSS